MNLCWVCVTDQRQQFLDQRQQFLQQPLCSSVFQPVVANNKLQADSFIEPAAFAACRYINPLSTQVPLSATPYAAGNFVSDLKLDWRYLPGTATVTPVTLQLSGKTDTSKHFHIFVGDLCPYLQPDQLKDAFSVFGQISDYKIIQDPQTMRSKGYGFVTFVKKEDAANAIKAMNGRQLGTRVIRTNWAIRKLSAGINGKPTFEEVIKQTNNNNCTVYCGGIMTGLTEDVVREAFSSYGSIEDIRIFEEKGYAFVRFSSKEAATEAIVSLHLTEINGHTVKCSWGKKGDDNSSDVPMSSSPATPVPSFMNPQSSNFQLTTDYCQLAAQHAFTAPKPSTARLPVASPVNYYVYDTSATAATAAECSVAQLQRLTDCSSNIVLQQQFANEYRPSFAVHQLPALTAPCNAFQQPNMAHVLPPGVVLAPQPQPPLTTPPGVVYTIHPVV